MQSEKIPFDATGAFSSFFLDYIHQKDSLKPFYHRFPSRDQFNEQLNEKAAAYSASSRQTLVAALHRQYDGYNLPEQVIKNLNALAQPGTFTVTTGHQLNIFTGPLYFIYKIITVINTCRQLKDAYPQHHFVPVYWMASEDHDYEEIKSFRLDGKKYTWETKQQGAVGRFHTKDFNKLLNEVPGNTELFRKAYTQHETLAGAVRYYVNELFGEDGLIVIDGDDHALKQLFIPVMEQDLFHHITQQQVNDTNAALEASGYKAQVYCREINFFYLDNQLRSRIEKTDSGFAVVDTPLTFSNDEMLRHHLPLIFADRRQL